MKEAQRMATLMLLSVLLLALLLRLAPAMVCSAAAPVSFAASSPPLINAHLLLAVRLVTAQFSPSSPAMQPVHLSLRLSCASPSARLTQNRDVELGPPSPWPSPHRGLGPLPGLWSAQTIFEVEMARTPRQCRLFAFEKKSGVRLGSKAFTLPGTGSDETTDALVQVELPVRLDRPQHGRPIDILRTLSFLLRGTWGEFNAFTAIAYLRLRQLWRGASEMWVRAAAAASTKAAALTSPAAALLHASLADGTAAGGLEDALWVLAPIGVLVFFVSILSVSRRLLFAAFDTGAADGQCRQASTPAAGSQRTTGEQQLQPQESSQRTSEAFIPTDWHCVTHDRVGGAARMDARALADLTHAVGAGSRGAAEATIGVVGGQLLNNSVRGVLLSYKGQ